MAEINLGDIGTLKLLDKETFMAFEVIMTPRSGIYKCALAFAGARAARRPQAGRLRAPTCARGQWPRQTPAAARSTRCEAAVRT